MANLRTVSMFLLGLADAARVQTNQGGLGTGQPNPPEWPASVQVYGPDDDGIDEQIRDATECLTDRVCGHWSDQRAAFMFKPGVYNNLSINVGYYMQILGLGERADGVIFREGRGIYSPAMDQRRHENGFSAGSLDCFWRGAENFKQEGDLMWAVSQAAPMRRIHVAKDLHLHDAGRHASGGYFADTQVDGKTVLGSQQQWFMRSSTINTEDPAVMGGAWNIVMVGVTGGPKSIHPKPNEESKAISNIRYPPAVAEKPFVTIDAKGRFYLNVPPIRRNRPGSTLNEPPSSGRTKTIPFEKVFVARNDRHNAKEIQAKLDDGFHVVLAAGIFNLDDTLTLKSSNQVLLGIGMATLMAPEDGRPCIRVLPHTPGVRVAGVMLGARGQGKVMLEWGDEGVKDDSGEENPGVMTDIFARVGGPDQDRTVSSEVIVKVHSDFVIGDNLWLWRADHAKLGEDDPDLETRQAGRPECIEYHCVQSGEYNANTGLEVNGDHVIMYGLFVEHTTSHNTLWKGEHGRVYFYQNELPYDGCHPEASGYVVDDAVRFHQAHGVGVYTFFRDQECLVDTAFRLPEQAGIKFDNAFSRFLNGNGGIGSVMNRFGGEIHHDKTMHRVGKYRGSVDRVKCYVGDVVLCVNSTRNECSGNQCCLDGTICPSAEPGFKWCKKPKAYDCL